jgi:hypothetical protein
LRFFSEDKPRGPTRKKVDTADPTSDLPIRSPRTLLRCANHWRRCNRMLHNLPTSFCTFGRASELAHRRNRRPVLPSCLHAGDGGGPHIAEAFLSMRSALPEEACPVARRRSPPTERMKPQFRREFSSRSPQSLFFRRFKLFFDVVLVWHIPTSVADAMRLIKGRYSDTGIATKTGF